MVSNADDLRKKVEELKKQLAGLGEASKGDPRRRTLRKELKRAQRRLAGLTPLSLEQQLARSQKFSDLIAKRLSDMTKSGKKSQADPFVHSLRKKTKSFNRRIKKLNRLIEKGKRSNPPPTEAKPTS
ncbi:MAG: hypothetical protein HY716_01405 [Planctomycetes bacterium]|nr:hypothetical protein [Planctomycetota bacterium]